MSTFQPFITPYYVSWAEETIPFTEESPINWLGAVQSIDPTQKNNVERHRSAGALNYFAWTPGRLENLFSIRYKVNNGQFMLMCFGSESVVGSDPYTHTLEVARPLPKFTLEFAAVHPTLSFVRRFVGSVVQKLTLALDVNGVLFADVDCIAREVEKYTTKTTVTPITTPPYNFDQGALTFNAGSIITLRNYEYTLDNGVEGIPHIGTRKIAAYSEGGADNTLTMELTAKAAADFYDLAFADPPTQVDANIDHIRTASSDEFNIDWFSSPIDENKLAAPDDVRGGAFTERITLPMLYAEVEVIDSLATY